MRSSLLGRSSSGLELLAGAAQTRPGQDVTEAVSIWVMQHRSCVPPSRHHFVKERASLESVVEWAERVAEEAW